MWQDPIVEEIRTRRDEHAAQFGYDIQAIVEALRQEEKESGKQSVSLARPRTERLTSSSS
ncbi:MAG: hypothetical protein [Olavius algarvensis Gamma 1 endosymbiont]|nr:MAG: hypothetical protein [Olavius algarvensis Gamma 1 endosymbiont]